MVDESSRPLRPPSVASATISALQSPVITALALPAEGEPPDLTFTGEADGETDAESPPASGAATPTKVADATTPNGTARKSRGFLDLAPLSGFFKARYPSSTRGSSKADPPLEDEHHAGEATPTASSVNHINISAQAEAQAEESGSEDIEDDRRTIRASTSGDDLEEQKHRAKVQAGKGVVNGNGAAAGHAREPKAAGEKGVDAVRSPSMVDGVS